jgi:CubicO group peptidase (beta-lactamase class C family)
VNGFDRARDVLARGVAARVFPGAACEVGTAERAAWTAAEGAVTYEAGAFRVTADTVYDLASLTKPLAAATVAMRLVQDGRLDLGAAVADLQPAWRGADRARVTVTDLLEHASGLTDWMPLWKTHRGCEAVVAAAAEAPLASPPRERSIYSDLGFIVAGALLERVGGDGLDRLFERVWRGPASAPLAFRPGDDVRARCAPTRFSEARERLLQGDVDDDNTWAMGGVAGHAGLFGTAGAVGAFARGVLRVLQRDSTAERALVSCDVLRRFLQPSSVPASSRALGWDLMRPTSSCGARMSAEAFGHTGFTGTSLWIDPVRGVYAVLLTNRVHPAAGPNEPMQEIRRAFHDALLEDGGYRRTGG